MKINIEDATALPEALQSLVSETEEGGHALDLTLVAPAQELEKFKGKALTAEQEAIERRKALSKWKELGDDPDAIKAQIAEAQKGGKKTEEQQQIIDQMKADYEAKIQERDQKLRGTFQRQAVSDLKSELAKQGVVPEGLDLLAGYASQRIQFDDDGAPKVMAADGQKPMVGNGANGGATLADLAAELANSIPHLVADKGAGGSGKQPGSSGGTPKEKSVTREQFDAMSQAQRSEHVKSGGKVVD